MSTSSAPAGRRRLVALALLLAALPMEVSGASQAAGPPGGWIRVTAGEHGEFSRVVFALGAGLTYHTELEPGGLRVVFPDALVGFDYDEVYPKRRARRVSMAEPALNADGVSLRLRFGCDCDARTFVLGPKLVVDVFDAAPGASDPERSERAPQPDRARTPSAVVDPAGARAPERVPASAQKTSSGARKEGQPRPEFLQRVQGPSDPQPLAPGSGSAPDPTSFDPAHLERMLAWAIEHGHLTGTSAGSDPAPLSPRPEDAVNRTARDAAMSSSDEPTSSSGAGVSSKGAAAAESATAAQERAEASSGSSCPDGSALDMAVHGGQGTFAAERARLQEALSRAVAVDHGIAQAEHALAGFYIARLMPQEALAVLGKTDDEGPFEPARLWLQAAALVLADRSEELEAGALRHSTCKGGDVELWRAVMLAAEGSLPQRLLESDLLLSRLAEYPPDLRVELGLRLAEAGIDGNAPDALERLLELVEDADLADEARARLLFLRGRLAAARGDFAGARASWRGGAGLPGEGGVRSTLALVGAELEEGELDETAALAQLERLAYDWRGHPLQLPIAELAAAVHERRGDLLHALGALEEVALGAAGHADGRAAARLATDLMRRTYADASSTLPADQMAAFWRYEGFVPPGPEGADVRLALARALLAQGLPGPAIKLLAPIAQSANGTTTDQAIDLLVEGYLAVQEPEKALDLLRTAARQTPAAGSQRNLLAAGALAALGRFAEAAGVLHDSAGDEADRLHADYLWKAGLWKDAAEAYRELLENGFTHDQPDAARQAAIRLAAAAHMAKRPALAEEAWPIAAAADEAAVTAFAPLPPVRSRGAAHTTATQLLKQAQQLGELAGQYGIGIQETQ